MPLTLRSHAPARRYLGLHLWGSLFLRSCCCT